LKALAEAGEYHRDWAYALGTPELQASFKSRSEDFVVKECLPFQPCGDGQHAYLRIRKIGLNTEDVARRLQRFCRVKAKAIGYAGLKDKRAVSEQWFSVDLAGLAQAPAWQELQSDQLQILNVERHRKRLRIGWVKSNQFEIVLRDASADRALWESRLTLIRDSAVPNYFGEQRFGVNNSNIANSVELLMSGADTKRRELVPGKRGFHYSVLRSFLFNEQLSARINAANWQQALPGELLILDGSQSFFQCQQVDSEIERRLREFDIHPSAALPGKEKSPTQDDQSRFVVDQAQHFEQSVLQAYQPWVDALAQQGVMAARRALRIKPQQFDWNWIGDAVLCIHMTLPAGAYATTVLRELLNRNSYITSDAGEE